MAGRGRSRGNQRAQWGRERPGTVGAVSIEPELRRTGSEERLIAATLKVFRAQSQHDRERVGEVLRLGVLDIQAARVQRMREQLADASQRAGSLGTMLTRESKRAAALKHWGMQSQYAPESTLSGGVGDHFALANTHATVMYKVLEKLSKAVAFRRLRKQCRRQAKAQLLCRINGRTTHRLALLGPVRGAWSVWHRFVILERYSERMRERQASCTSHESADV